MDGYRFAAPAAFGPNWSLILTSVNIWALTGRSNALGIVVVAPHLFSPQNTFHAACRQSFSVFTLSRALWESLVTFFGCPVLDKLSL